MVPDVYKSGFTAETQSSRSSEYFLSKFILLCVLSASAVDIRIRFITEMLTARKFKQDRMRLGG
jgi:hypothetical protein